MSPKTKFGLKYAAWVFLVLFVGCGVTISVSVLLVAPYIRWFNGAPLYFPTSRTDLLGLLVAVLVLSTYGALATWIIGKIKGDF